jgi:hypothetical protein
MTDALTARSWLTTLWQIEATTHDPTVRTMSQMLLDIMNASNITDVAEVFDRHGLRMLSS